MCQNTAILHPEIKENIKSLAVEIFSREGSPEREGFERSEDAFEKSVRDFCHAGFENLRETAERVGFPSRSALPGGVILQELWRFPGRNGNARWRLNLKSIECDL